MQHHSSATQDHLNKLFRALESFYHPSNNGRYTVSGEDFKSRAAPLKVVAPFLSFFECVKLTASSIILCNSVPPFILLGKAPAFPLQLAKRND